MNNAKLCVKWWSNFELFRAILFLDVRIFYSITFNHKSSIKFLPPKCNWIQCQKLIGKWSCIFESLVKRASLSFWRFYYWSGIILISLSLSPPPLSLSLNIVLLDLHCHWAWIWILFGFNLQIYCYVSWKGQDFRLNMLDFHNIDH